jgi:hypothetical protein
LQEKKAPGTDRVTDRSHDVDTIEQRVLEAIARDDAVDAFALLFLLRRFQATGRDDLNDALGIALASALARHTSDSSTFDRAAWLQLFAEATSVSDDERLAEATRALMVSLRGDWNLPAAAIESTAASVDACFHAAGFPDARALVAEAVDRLERLVACAYSPGDGMRGGGFADQVRSASALLSAYELSGRLPYSMLAEELMQAAQRVTSSDFMLNCEAARVLCRLAALHGDASYRAAAVIAPGVDYRVEAERLLSAQSTEACRRGAGAGIYALAALELESLEV